MSLRDRDWIAIDGRLEPIDFDGFADDRSPGELTDLIVEAYETRIGPHIGQRVVARAWHDPEFKHALLHDATAAVATIVDGHVGDHLVAVENTPERHNMVVCTLCSCYPWDVLGLPPVWYKSAPYRSRAVKDPRGVLALCIQSVLPRCLHRGPAEQAAYALRNLAAASDAEAEIERHQEASRDDRLPRRKIVEVESPARLDSDAGQDYRG